MPLERIGLEEAAKLSLRDDALFVPGSSGEPATFLQALANGAVPQQFGIISGFVSGINRFATLPADAAVTGFFPPPGPLPPNFNVIEANYFEIDAWIARLRPETAVCEVMPRGADGSVALGLAVDFAETSLAVAERRIALVNPMLPELPGAPRVSLDVFTHVVEAPSPTLELSQSPGDAVSEQIVRNVATLIPDGSTIQVGIGKIPSHLMARLSDRRNLRFHSGIVTKGIRALFEAGALVPDEPVVCASLGGDADFYRWLHGRRGIRLAPVAYTHDPDVLAGLEGLIAINSAIEVDLSGRVNAVWLKGRRISGPGGLPNFAAGARRSRNGLVVIALPASDALGATSRIVSRLSSPPTIEEGNIDVVVTEYGVADLRGRSPDQRCAALVAVAAPQFRAELTSASPA